MTNNRPSRFADDSTFAHREVTSRKRIFELLSFENLRGLPNLMDQIPPENETISITMLKDDYDSIKDELDKAPYEDDVAAAFRDKFLDYNRYFGNVYVILAARLKVPGQDELNKALEQPEYADAKNRVALLTEVHARNQNTANR